MVCEWGAVLVQDWARYLGFALGPGMGNRSWSKAVDKARARCKQWSQQPLGAQLAAFAYKVYVVSTLGFVAQLESLPVDAQRTEEGLLRTMVRGPRRWCSVEDLHRRRRDFGPPTSTQTSRKRRWLPISDRLHGKPRHLEASVAEPGPPASWMQLTERPTSAE